MILLIMPSYLRITNGQEFCMDKGFMKTVTRVLPDTSSLTKWNAYKSEIQRREENMEATKDLKSSMTLEVDGIPLAI